jgi:RimJ/RimL family protein N-acetyltransferase
MILETGRLSLRPCSMDDVDALHALWTDADVRRYLWDGAVIDRETAQETVQSALEDWADYGVGLFCIRFRREPAIIGFCGLRRYPPDDEWELLYGLAPAHWGQGLAVEAARAVLGLCFFRASRPSHCRPHRSAQYGFHPCAGKTRHATGGRGPRGWTRHCVLHHRPSGGIL